MTTTIHPTRQALRVHLSHLATTHRAPLVPRRLPTSGTRTQRTRATSFTPMARDPYVDGTPRTQSHES